MLTRLDPTGHLYPPESITSARERIIKIDIEIITIRRDLLSRSILQFDLTPSYLEWRIGATEKLEALKSERTQTLAWIESELWHLLKDTTALLRTLHDEDTHFEQHELVLLERCEKVIKERAATSGGTSGQGTG